MPAAAVIPAPAVYTNIAAVKKLVVDYRAGSAVGAVCAVRDRSAFTVGRPDGSLHFVARLLVLFLQSLVSCDADSSLLARCMRNQYSRV